MRFVTDDDVINNIADDILYLKDMVTREKKSNLNQLKIAHLGRLVTVVAYNCLDAYKDFIARNSSMAEKTIAWNDFFQHPKIAAELESVLTRTSFSKFNSIDEVKAFIYGLKALRDFIAHGLVDESANEFKKKIQRLEAVSLKISPSRITMDDIDRILEIEDEVSNVLAVTIMGMKD